MSENREIEKAGTTGSSGLIDELQHGISHEAQPMLKFLIDNFKRILVALGAFVFIVAAYGLYDYSAKSALESSRMELGDILVNKSGAAQLESLEGFIAKAPEKIRPAALFELAKLSVKAGDFDKAIGAWNTLASSVSGEMSFIARLGKAQALSAAGKADEAFAALEAVESGAPEGFKNIATLQLAVAAEQAGKLDRALAAYETLQTAGSNTDKELFAQKIVSLKARIAAKG